MQLISKENIGLLFSTLEDMIPCNSDLLKDLKSGQIAAGFLRVVRSSAEFLWTLIFYRKARFLS